ncbi:MAG: response regulator [Lachnospiraceae bacterium]|nr:response regulator [Lachnospiraceae bacterium]
MITAYIADDEVWVVLGLKKQLEKSGSPVEVIGTANNGLTARAEIRQKQPDVVFTDIRMPGENGLDLLRDIGTDSPKSKVVIISGYADFSYAQQAISGHAYEYLVKPIHQEDLDALLLRLQSELHPEQTKEEAAEENRRLQEESEGDADRVIRWMAEHYMEEVSLQELAEKLQMSSAALSRALKSRLGVTFSEHLTSLRIQRAKELLADPTLSIEEVAVQCGIPDYFYFTKVFKKVEGISPSKYRKEL